MQQPVMPLPHQRLMPQRRHPRHLLQSNQFTSV
jgi:hypothetical protein